MTSWGKLELLVTEWRRSNYASDSPLIAELLFYQKDQTGQLTYLRDPQYRALEVYWYLRLKLDTPKFLGLYDKLFEKRSEKFQALGIEVGQDFLDFENENEYLAHIAKQPANSALAESLSLDYASYIMALTMGAGKTVLIGTIIATEFAMSLEYGDDRFMKNALVFAPGTTIIESLKEISDIPYDKILPARVNKKFQANVKLIYAQTGDKDIQAQTGSSYNVVVTNTEKIALKKRTIRKGQTAFDFEKAKEHDSLIANRRLTTIASLPSLGVFSDEAHHTYGNKLGDEIKRVRETINYLHNEANLICVVNTTGTPYAGSKSLMDVVFWYSLDQGIKDNVLKSLDDSIIAYDFGYTAPPEVFQEVISDFFTKYCDTRLVTGQQAKIAFYFKSQEHLDESRPQIEKALTDNGESPSLILMNTQQSSESEVDEFKRLNDPGATKRVILLVGKGTEGWNCPSLFATALIREITSSNNFILQASTRCLRQVAGNNQPATIYVESHNQRILNDELRKTFGTSLYDLSKTKTNIQETNAIFYKTNLPKLEITKIIKRVVKAEQKQVDINLTKPANSFEPKLRVEIFTPVTENSGVILSNTGEESEITFVSDSYDLFTAAQKIAENYHLKPLTIYDKLAKIYTNEVPRPHLEQLFDQVEAQTTRYVEQEEQITQALALIKFVDDEGNATFSKNNDDLYYHTIRYSVGNADLITRREDYAASNKRGLGFHYSPYNFDSHPEKAFLEEMLGKLKVNHEDVEDIYFTGGLTETKQTDMHFQYKGEDGRYHNYFPDFVIVKNSGDFLIIEIKAENKVNDPEVRAKAKAVEVLAKLPKNKFKYHILYTDTPIPTQKLQAVMELIK